VSAGYLTTHVLDTVRGLPGAGMTIALSRRDRDGWVAIRRTITDADGRPEAELLAPGELEPGEYELLFAVGRYFAEQRVVTAEPPYLADVPVRVMLADPNAHYHVPLLVSPWSYTTYRGS
jgi:5-hydroxyisourate hydrolase